MDDNNLKKWQENFFGLLKTSSGSLQKGYFIPKGEGRRLVIPDIHGCLQTFNKLLEKVNFNKHDQLFIIGDMVNRGLYSALVVDLIIDYIKRGYQIYPLRGNHEQMLLETNKKSRSSLFNYVKKHNSLHLLDENEHLKSKYRRFFESLPYFYETEEAFLVHAGFNFDKTKPFENTKDMLWIKGFYYDEEATKGKTIYHGHDPLELSLIKKNIKHGKKIIALDNGCVTPGKKDMGNLLCLNIDSKMLHLQVNIDTKRGK